MSEKSVEQLRAEIAASRERLAGTIDELTTRAAPKALMQRQGEAAKQRFAAATTTPQGDLRTERLAAVAAAVAVLLVVRCMLRRRGH
ncbi:MAG: DUF3618 domain-containing protein [Actinobacteria bacterium]|uniref:DUF3618 domain-containing protein n=1 Tax=Nostocoides veronense TaxID=330836 RepID=A0ABP4YD26_9MICO|nr:DUF3618 domain-containing protein [Actinomycetota bacterium]